MTAGPANRSESLARRLPDTYLLIAAVGLLVFLAGFVFSPGRFDLQQVTLADGGVTQRVDPESFRYVDEAERGPDPIRRYHTRPPNRPSASP